MKTEFRLFCFDMDGTLIRNTNSVKYLCELNNKEKELLEIEKREDNRELTWIEADYLKAELIKGLSIEKVTKNFNNCIQLINNIEYVVNYLKKQGIKSILVTAGPAQVANIVGELFDFDRVYASSYEVKNNAFTGRITEHLGEGGKLRSLLTHCKSMGIQMRECAAVGDSDSDIDIFSNCGKSVAVNYSDVLVGKADIYLRTEDLKDILKYI